MVCMSKKLRVALFGFVCACATVAGFVRRCAVLCAASCVDGGSVKIMLMLVMMAMLVMISNFHLRPQSGHLNKEV